MESPPCNLIIKLANKSKSVEEFLDELPTLTQSNIQNIEHETVGQSNNYMWVLQRKGILTASNFYSVFTKVYFIKEDPENACKVEPLIKKIMGYESHYQDIPALKHGHMFEPIAREKYLSLIKNSHSGFKFRECGLFIDSQKIYLGASPDLCIDCDCCGSGVAEFKCPYSIAHEKPTEQNLNYLVSNGSGTTLKRKHPYFAQIQGQMALTKKKYCDFFVYTRVGYFQERIHYDPDYWFSFVSSLEYFFHNFLAKELVFEEVKQKIEFSKDTES
ncbi:uncharacterized protein LOC116293690 [Actinia tenebrosa]|uniref:Uncharacterized protein LOC116293690 n=1 Tax=Actinia tenebrosa TaxID=6105 RepID=A0A6P8HWH3_ACTTE|nr:uncharacterized protein LOC116293690 [Actinia tenebrosa]